jgi:hypothetical protein
MQRANNSTFAPQGNRTQVQRKGSGRASPSRMVDTQIVKQGYGALTQINAITVGNIRIDSHVIGCLYLLFFDLEICLYVVYDMRGTGDSPHKAEALTRAEE